jgi:formate-dependent nitrite reductase membrane component NrfD
VALNSFYPNSPVFFLFQYHPSMLYTPSFITDVVYNNNNNNNNNSTTQFSAYTEKMEIIIQVQTVILLCINFVFNFNSGLHKTLIILYHRHYNSRLLQIFNSGVNGIPIYIKLMCSTC